MKLDGLLFFALVTAVCIPLVTQTHAQSPQTTDVDAAIRKSAQEFTEVFDRGDVAALASHFTAGGVYIDEDGQRFEGRDAIAKEYDALFQSASDLKLKVEIDSIQQLSPTTVIEEGRLAILPQPPGASRVMSAYTAVHTLQDGKWLIAHVRDTRVVLPADSGQLEDLNWLVGTWAAEDEDTRVEVKGRWIENNHFLARTHSVTESDKVTSTGLEIIGVDPSSGQVTSWSFSSDGGYAVGRWAPTESGWIVDSAGMALDGTQTIAINSLSQRDQGTLVFNSTNRFADETPLPDIEDVTLKRK